MALISCCPYLWESELITEHRIQNTEYFIDNFFHGLTNKVVFSCTWCVSLPFTRVYVGSTNKSAVVNQGGAVICVNWIWHVSTDVLYTQEKDVSAIS